MRELDAEVAVKVLGWTHIGDITKWPAYDPDKHFCRSDQNDWWLAPNEEQPACGPCYCLPAAYSTSIADAWLVVEEMRKRGYWYRLEATLQTTDYFATFGLPTMDPSGGGVHRHGNAHAHGMPEAICLAALESIK